MLSFDGVVEFIAVAETTGFSAAARRLGVSTSHVSRQIVRLEERLGCALFIRTTRSVTLTHPGQRYYEHCRELLNGLQVANEHVGTVQSQLTGTLRVSAAGAFAERFVAPALMTFGEQHPDLCIELFFDSRMASFLDDGIDFAIRYGQLVESSLIARKLVARPLLAAASPDYLAKHGTPLHPGELGRHACLIANNDRWQFVEPDGTRIEIRVQGPWRSNNVHTILEAARRGLGIIYIPVSSYFDTLTTGDLVPILEPYASQAMASWVVYRDKQFQPLRVRLAIDHLVSASRSW